MKNLKNFGITFAVSFAILGIIALFACGFVSDTICSIFDGKGKNIDNILTPGDTTASEEQDEKRLAKEVSGESFTWLLAVSDYRPNVFDDYYPNSADNALKLGDFKTLGKNYRFTSASNIVLIRAFVTTREYLIVTIPAQTRITEGKDTFTLGDYYAIAGIDGLSAKVSALTGFYIDYYSVIHSTDLSTLANTVGSIECTLPVSIYTDGKNYVSAPPVETTSAVTTNEKSKDTKATTEANTAPKLSNELDAADSVNLAVKLMAALLYYDPSNGIDDEMTIEQSFANGLMTNLSDMSDSTLQSCLSSLNKCLVYSNITSDDIYLNGDVIRGYSWFEIHTMTYPGKFVSGKNSASAYYKPDTERAVNYFYAYR